MSDPAVVYSKAIFGSAQKHGKVDKVGKDLANFHNVCLLSKELRSVLYFSVFSRKDRNAIVKEICKKIKVLDLSEKFLLVLIEKNRMNLLAQILNKYMSFEDMASNAVSGTLSSAFPMASKEVEAVCKKIGERLNRKVKLETKTQEALLGGFVVNVGGKIFDASVSTQLARLKEHCVQ